MGVDTCNVFLLGGWASFWQDKTKPELLEVLLKCEAAYETAYDNLQRSLEPIDNLHSDVGEVQQLLLDRPDLSLGTIKAKFEALYHPLGVKLNIKIDSKYQNLR